MAICKDRPDIRGGELRFNGAALWATMLVMFAWMVILVVCQAVAKSADYTTRGHLNTSCCSTCSPLHPPQLIERGVSARVCWTIESGME